MIGVSFVSWMCLLCHRYVFCVIGVSFASWCDLDAFQCVIDIDHFKGEIFDEIDLLIKVEDVVDITHCKQEDVSDSDHFEGRMSSQASIRGKR